MSQYAPDCQEEADYWQEQPSEPPTKQPMKQPEDMKTKGYYRVKFFNHKRLMILFWNGKQFEKFPSDIRINDEIESYKKVEDTTRKETERDFLSWAKENKHEGFI